MKTAYLFPGQGSQFVGMGRDLCERFPEAKAVFEEADRILDAPLSRICFDGPEDELRQTRNTQPAIFVHSVAVLRVLGLTPAGPDNRAAGHSLGEYSAYVAAGALSFEDGLRLVRRRGELMHEAGVARPGTMAAVLGMERTTLEGVLGGIPGIVCAANFNSPSQIVISGEVGAVEQAMGALREAGAKKVVPLSVGGAFHSPLMESAARGLAEMLGRTTFENARCSVVANASASPVDSAAGIPGSLERQLLSPVRWEETVRSLLDWGAERFVEIGPGKVLSGLVKAVDKQVPTVPVGDPSQIEAFLEGERRS